MNYDAFQETGHGPVPGRVHYVERGNRGHALCGLAQVDNSVRNRWVSTMLPLNPTNGASSETVDGPKCDRCEKLRNLKSEV